MVTTPNLTRRSSSMNKRKAIVVAAALCTVPLAAGSAGAGPERPNAARPGCTVRNIAGTYGLMSSGTLVSAPPGIPTGPFAAVGRLDIRADGAVSADATQSFNGTIFSEDATPGTIEVDADCTGSLVLAGVQTFDFVVSDRRHRLEFIQTNPGTVITVVALRQ